MYPMDVHGPKPADITTNAFNTFSPLSLTIFLASFENLSPGLSSANYPMWGISICSSLKGIVCDGDNETRNEQVQSNVNTGIPARALLGH